MKEFTVSLVDLDTFKLDVMRKLADKMVYENKADVNDTRHRNMGKYELHNFSK